MRQVMPHRNNMCMRRSKGKGFLRRVAVFRGGAAILQHTFRRRKFRRFNNIIRYKGLRRAQAPPSGATSKLWA